MPEERSVLTDEQVVGEALSHKERFVVLVQRYQDPLSRYLRRLGVWRTEDAEDVLQNVFLKAYRNLNDFDPRLKFSAWIYRIAHNEAVSFFRSNSARPEGSLIDDSELVLDQLRAEIDIERSADRTLTAERLSTALSKLDAKYRDAIVLRFFEERSYEEMSDILQVPLGTVATLLNRAKKRLKTVLISNPSNV
jgi:RNA polymerase sigma-70 factor (ECF subfamily)